jgi:hypothetical protein
MFCISLFVLLSFFFWPLYCLSFFNLRLLMTPLVSFGHCIVCPSSTYGFWWPLWYLLSIALSVLLQSTASDDKRKKTTGQTTIYKTTHRKPKIKNTNPIKTGSIHWCCGRVSSSCFTYRTRRIILVSSLCRNLKGNITHNWKPLNFQMILLLFLLNI